MIHIDSTSRRSFLKKGLAGAGLGVSMPRLLHMFDYSREKKAGMDTEKVVVFQGDSITDGGREKDEQMANRFDSLGHGYAAMGAAHILGHRPLENWQCYNRGISGNKVHQLAARWEEDCLELKPDVLSILIGVNDFWHTLNLGYEGTVEIYERDYRTLLDLTMSALPELKLIIGEPFAVYGGSAIDNSTWYPAFDDYRAAARRIAEEYDAVWVPYQSVFDEALQDAPAEYWCPDGVHPSLAGSYLMTHAWLEGFEKALKG